MDNEAVRPVQANRIQVMADYVKTMTLSFASSSLTGDKSSSLPGFTSIILFLLVPLALLVLFSRFFKPIDVTRSFPSYKAPALTTTRPETETSSEIISLHIYPIKSCRGISVPSARLLRSGLSLDRNWMFVDASTSDFQTIRENETMTLIDTAISSDQSSLTISIAASSSTTAASVTIATRPTQAWLEENCTRMDVNIWGSSTEVYAYPDPVNTLFSAHFGKPVLLVYKAPSLPPRLSRGSADPELYGQEVPHHFADVLSVTIASASSLADLNKRLEESADSDRSKCGEALTMERFRPNIVIKGGVPWEEDSWKRVRITPSSTSSIQGAEHSVDLDIVSRCARCQVPNVNPSTGDKNAKEPWNTLMKFRRVDTGGVAKWKPCFAMMALPKGEAEIVVRGSGGGKETGSVLTVLERTDKHLYNTAKFEDL